MGHSHSRQVANHSQLFVHHLQPGGFTGLGPRQRQHLRGWVDGVKIRIGIQCKHLTVKFWIKDHIVNCNLGGVSYLECTRHSKMNMDLEFELNNIIEQTNPRMSGLVIH